MQATNTYPAPGPEME